jgi:hypothetical protein
VLGVHVQRPDICLHQHAAWDGDPLYLARFHTLSGDHTAHITNDTSYAKEVKDLNNIRS